MTILEAINQVDALLHNTYSQDQKRSWLSQLDGMVTDQIFQPHAQTPGEVFAGYDQQTPGDTVLCIGAPFDQIYHRWLEAQIHYHNGEISRYNNAIALFNTEYAAFADRYHRTHRMSGAQNRFF